LPAAYRAGLAALARATGTERMLRLCEGGRVASDPLELMLAADPPPQTIPVSCAGGPLDRDPPDPSRVERRRTSP
jgi:hypothetical protein